MRGTYKVLNFFYGL